MGNVFSDGGELRVILPAGGYFDGMTQQKEECRETLFSAAFTAGQIDNECLAAQSGNPAREPCHRIVFGSFSAHGFGEARNVAIDYVERCLGSAIARTEARAPDGEDQLGAYTDPFEKARSDCVFFIGSDGFVDAGIRPMLTEEIHNGGARCINHQALRTAIRDGENAE